VPFPLNLGEAKKKNHKNAMTLIDEAENLDDDFITEKLAIS